MIHALHLLWIVPLVSCVTVAGMSVFIVNSLRPNMDNYPKDRIQEGNYANTAESEQENCRGHQSENQSE
jgi:hypothetical protein